MLLGLRKKETDFEIYDLDSEAKPTITMFAERWEALDYLKRREPLTIETSV